MHQHFQSVGAINQSIITSTYYIQRHIHKFIKPNPYIQLHTFPLPPGLAYSHNCTALEHLQ